MKTGLQTKKVGKHCIRPFMFQTYTSRLLIGPVFTTFEKDYCFQKFAMHKFAIVLKVCSNAFVLQQQTEERTRLEERLA